MLQIEKTLKEITKNWFFSDPLLFSVACTHAFVENPYMNVPMRSGCMRIEYSPEQLAKADSRLLEAYLRFEMYRILLQHPYNRKPYNPKPGILLAASDVTIYQLLLKDKENSWIIDELKLPGIEYLKNQAVRFHTLEHPLGIKWHLSDEEKFFQRNLQIERGTGHLICVDKLSFEEWYRWILFLVSETSITGENAGASDGAAKLSQEAAELWEENEEAQQEIKSQLEKSDIDQGWGGLGGEMQRELKESCDFSFDYRRALAHFRQNVVSANRKLTRMRPSRRYGFKAMGSRYERKADILIAVDVSGSITDESFEHFTHAIKNFFFLGMIEKIDLIFFDVNLKNSKPVEFRKKIELEQIKGRGGTSFQPALDFYKEHSADYSGLIIFTDGEGAIPSTHGCNNILWILDSRLAWEKSRPWINTLPGNQSTYLPF